MTKRLHAFPPLATPSATRLILGSMPGEASLHAQQYYAHPRNAFWPIMAALFGCAATAPYAARVQALHATGVAVWDVLQSCTRTGSLDTAIEPASMVANDFAAFFAAHPQITRVYFNGSKAESTFKRMVRPQLPALPLTYLRLPSTSPAHAALSYDKKLAAWKLALSQAN